MNGMHMDLKIRLGTHQDAKVGSLLYYQASKETFDFLFEGRTQDQILTMIEQSFKQIKHMNSYRYTMFATLDDVPVAMALGYFGSQEWDQAISYFRVVSPIRYIKRLLSTHTSAQNSTQNSAQKFQAYNDIVLPIQENDYYLSALGVLPEYRNQKIGSFLLTKLEETCHKRNMAGIALDVSIENTKAKNFYTRHGYQLQEIRKNDYIVSKGYFSGYERWYKPLSVT